MSRRSTTTANPGRTTTRAKGTGTPNSSATPAPDAASLHAGPCTVPEEPVETTQAPGGTNDGASSPLENWTIEKVHLEAQRRSPADPTRANFGTSDVPVSTGALAMAVAVQEPPIATLIIGAVCVAMFLVSALLGLFEPIRGYRAVVLMGGNVPPMVMDGQYFRLLMSIFLHAGIGHLILNLFGLYFVGRVAEPLFGSGRFLELFLVTGMAGSLTSALVRADGVAVGASGGILGLLGALVVYVHRSGKILPENLRKQLYWTFVPWLLFSLYTTLVMPSVDMGAHFGGLAAGVVMGLAVESPVVNPWATRPRGFVASVVLTAAVSGWLLASWVVWLVRVTIG